MERLVENPFRYAPSLIDLHMPGLHDQLRHGRRKRLLGLSPFRGKPRGSPALRDDPYYGSTRYKGFENNVRKKAQDLGVDIEGGDKASGIWQGTYEPAATMQVSGSPHAVDELARYAAQHYNQDAVMEWKPSRNGPDRMYTLKGVLPTSTAGEALGKHGFPGGQFTDDGLQIADFNGENLVGALNLAKDLGSELKVTPGHVAFVEQGEQAA